MFYHLKDKQSTPTFKKAISDGNIIVLYHADWCGYCQRFKPVWEELKKKLTNGRNPMCHIGEVESANMHHLPNVEVRSYPTILFYKQKPKTSNNTKTKTYLATPDVKPKQDNQDKQLNSFQELIQNMMMMKPEMTNEGESAKDNVVPFDGEDRSIDNLLNFIRKNADTKAMKTAKKVVKDVVNAKNKKKQSTVKMVNLTKKIADTNLTKKNSKVLNNKVKDSKTKKRTVSKNSKGMKKVEEPSLKKYKKAKKQDKTTEQEIMNSFKNEL
jgi:thiol-disulfide isomerase/thioredoxin